MLLTVKSLDLDSQFRTAGSSGRGQSYRSKKASLCPVRLRLKDKLVYLSWLWLPMHNCVCMQGHYVLLPFGREPGLKMVTEHLRFLFHKTWAPKKLPTSGWFLRRHRNLKANINQNTEKQGKDLLTVKSGCMNTGPQTGEIHFHRASHFCHCQRVVIHSFHEPPLSDNN